MTKVSEEINCPVCTQLVPPGQTECPNCGTIIGNSLAYTIQSQPGKKESSTARKRKKAALQLKPGDSNSFLETFQEILAEALKQEQAGDISSALVSYRLVWEFAQKNKAESPLLLLSAQVLDLLIQRTERLLVVPAPSAEDPTPPTPSVQKSPWDINIIDTFGSNENAWPIFDSRTSSCDVARSIIQNDRLLLEIAAIKNAVHFLIPEKIAAVTDFDLFADFKCIGGLGVGYYGLIFRNNRSQGINHFYLFSISDDHLIFRLSLRKDGIWKTILEKANCHAVLPGRLNRLGVSMRGTHFMLYINNSEVANAEDANILSGNLGVAAGLYNAGDRISLEISNFELHGKT